MTNMTKMSTIRISFLLSWAMLAAILFPVRTALAQQAEYGTITGLVTDSANAVAPNVSIKVVNQQTGVEKTISSDRLGIYEATYLIPGTYYVVAHAPGFKAFEHRDVLLEAMSTVRIDIHLEVGNVATQITVTAGTPVIETESSSLADVQSAHEIRDLPLNIFATTTLISVLTSLVPTGNVDQDRFGGARGTALYYSADGISANSPLFGTQNNFAEPLPESVSEMHFDYVNNKAEFGQVSNMSVISKSGQNDLHGRVFWMNTTSDLNARPFFSPSNAENIINDFDGSIGGPIRHNKTFFFGTYEGYRQRQSTILTPTVPTTAMDNGNFSVLLPTTIKNPFTGAVFPGNVIPAAMFNQASVKWQNIMYPAPNYGPATLLNANFRGAYGSGSRFDNFDIRVDHYVSSRNSLYVKFNYRRNVPLAIDAGLPPSILGYRYQVRNGRLIGLSDTWNLSPHLVNEFRAGYSRNNNPRNPATPPALHGQALINTLGIQGFPAEDPKWPDFPVVSISGFQTPGQAAGEVPVENTTQFIDQLTYIHGRHTLKMGYEFRPQDPNDIVWPSFGTYTYTNKFTGYAYADFLLGLPQTTALALPRSGKYTRFFFTSGFIQDDFKLSAKLTLNIGLRYEYDQPPHAKDNTIFNFDPANGDIVVPTTQVLTNLINPNFPKAIPIITAQQAGFPSPGLWNSNFRNITPRFGFAWRPWGGTSTVIRGGYGLFVADDLTANLIGPSYSGPFSVTDTYTNSITAGVPLLTFTNPFGAVGVPGSITAEAMATNIRSPKVNQWNLTIERNLGWNTGLRVSYIGTEDWGIIYRRNINQIPASTTPYSQQASKIPYPNYVTVNMNSNGGGEIYNALSVSVERKWNRGLSFFANWTWAHDTTDVDEQGNTEGGPVIEDTFNRAREGGPAEYSPAQRYIAYGVWQIPAGAGRRYLNRQGAANWILGGWELTPAFTSQTGQYLTPAFSGSDPSNTNTIGGRPDCIGNPMLPSSQRSINEWFNPAAFAVPPANVGRFGTCGNGVIEGPNRTVLSAGMYKSFKPTDRLTLRLEASFRNVLNHFNPGNPSLNISTPASIATITSQASAEGAGSRAGLLTLYIDF